jgi:hypothetical protein
LKLYHKLLLSTNGFNLNLRRFTVVPVQVLGAASAAWPART